MDVRLEVQCLLVDLLDEIRLDHDHHRDAHAGSGGDDVIHDAGDVPTAVPFERVLPLNALPEWIQVFAAVNPITYGVDAERAFFVGKDVMTVIP